MTHPDMTAPLIPDAEQRALALNPGESFLVEAPAGSGKTGLLIQRFLKLLAQVDDPREVLALTFTNKATGEMRERVLHALRDALAPLPQSAADFERLTHALAAEVLRRDAANGWHLLQRPHLLNIRTIDSLCGEIARSMPVSAGGIGSAMPVPDASPLYRRAAHAVMMRFGGEDAALNAAIETVLLHRDGDLAFCEKVLAEMLATREQWGRLVPLSERELNETYLENVVLPRLNRSLERAVCAELEEIRQCLLDEDGATIASFLRELAHVDGYKDEPSPYRGFSAVHSSPGATIADRAHWEAIEKLLLAGKNLRARFSSSDIKACANKALQEQLKDFVATLDPENHFRELARIRSLPPSTYPEAQWRVAKALFRLLQHAFVELKLLFMREDVCDFTEIALAARTVLHDNAAEVQTALGTRLQHLLVDEMQDTSSAQYQLLEDLTAGWDGRSQTIFLVGDPKQSIYLFRQARVELFQQSMETGLLGTLPLTVLRLTANFRSGAQIVEECNAVFAEIFPLHNAPDGDVVFHSSEAVRPAKPGEGIEWNLRQLPSASLEEARGQRREALRFEAKRVTRRILERRYENPSAKIAVLTRARSHVAEILHALAKEQIPYRAVEMEPLGERQEVLDCVAIVRALIHPADRTAWLAMLRAPWCGVGLADLFLLAAGDDATHRKESLREHLRTRAGSLEPESCRLVTRTLDVLDAALQHAGTQSLADRVERTWRALGGDATTDAHGRENVRLLLRVLDSMEAEGEAVTAANLDRRLERLFAEPSHAPDAVDVMTIHKSKGLEWDAVFVPGLQRVSASDRWPALDWLEMPGEEADGSRDVLLAPLPGKGDDAGALNQFVRAVRRRRSYAELKRLFYVAATRAKTRLLLSAWPDSRQGNEVSLRMGTLLKAAENAARPQLCLVAAKEPPVVDDAPIEQESLDLAAAAEIIPMPLPVSHRSVWRLPSSYDPQATLHRLAPLPRGGAAIPAAAFDRPEGSFGARAVGSVIHAFVERLAREIAQRMDAGETSSAAMTSLVREIAGWQTAIRNVLRAGGLPSAESERAIETVQRALQNLLTSEDGRWVMLPHRGADSESAWRGGEGGETRVRLDRSFFAGPGVGAPGDDTLWIVDFKTGDHAGANVEAYLRDQRKVYEPQLRTYAEARLHALPEYTPVMLALFFPLMGRMVSWPYTEQADSVVATAPSLEESPKEDRAGQFQLFG